MHLADGSFVFGIRWVHQFGREATDGRRSDGCAGRSGAGAPGGATGGARRLAPPLQRHPLGVRPAHPGAHTFRYLADGGRWLDEPDADLESNGYGTTHSVLVVA